MPRKFISKKKYRVRKGGMSPKQAELVKPGKAPPSGDTNTEWSFVVGKKTKKKKKPIKKKIVFDNPDSTLEMKAYKPKNPNDSFRKPIYRDVLNKKASMEIPSNISIKDNVYIIRMHGLGWRDNISLPQDITLHTFTPIGVQLHNITGINPDNSENNDINNNMIAKDFFRGNLKTYVINPNDEVSPKFPNIILQADIYNQFESGIYLLRNNILGLNETTISSFKMGCGCRPRSTKKENLGMWETNDNITRPLIDWIHNHGSEDPTDTDITNLSHETGLSAEHIKDWFKQPIDRINELCHSDTFTLEDAINRIHRDMIKQNLPKALVVLNVCLGQTDDNFNKIQIERGLERTSSLKKSKNLKQEQMVDGVSGDRQFNPRDTSSDISIRTDTAWQASPEIIESRKIRRAKRQTNNKVAKE